MTLFVDGKRVITNAKGAVVRAKTRNYTNHKLNSAKEYDSICYSEELVDYCTNYQLDGYNTQYLPKGVVLSYAKSSRFKFYSVRRYLHSSFIKFKSEEFCFAQRTNKLSEYPKLSKNVRQRDFSRMGRLSANHNKLW